VRWAWDLVGLRRRGEYAISAYVQQNPPDQTLWVDIDFIEKHLN
jgi:hypothetical protein